jgi:hypothetical protein
MHSVNKVVITMFVEQIKEEFLLGDTQIGLMPGFACSNLGAHLLGRGRDFRRLASPSEAPLGAAIHSG